MKVKNGNSLSACVGAYVCTRARRLGKKTRSGGEEEKRRPVWRICRPRFSKSPQLFESTKINSRIC